MIIELVVSGRETIFFQLCKHYRRVLEGETEGFTHE